MYLRTEGVILKKRDFGEADRILTIFTRDFGKVICIAKGTRRPRSRKAGHVELGNWCKVFIAKGKNIDLLTEVEVKKPFGIDNFSPEKANKIYHLLEIVELLTAPHQKNLKVFIILVNFLKRITDGEDFYLISTVFKIKLLSTLGFFSARSLEKSKIRNFFEMIQDEGFENIKNRIRLKEKDYLKLLSFLDSMIEKIIEARLKTIRFVNGIK